MKTSTSTGAVMIALRFFPTGGRDFGPGDEFPFKDLGFTDRRLMQMRESRHIGPLTRESYERAMQSREAGYVGKGFTIDGLKAMGILDDGAPAAAEQGAADWAPDAKTYKVTERYGDIWLAGRKAGVATRFDLFNLEGHQLNPGKTYNGIAKAKEAADAIVATAEAEKAKDRPLFADHPVNLADWSVEQTEAFDAWYAALPEDDETPHKLLPAAVERFKQLQEAETQPPVEGFTAMTDEQLVEALTKAGLMPKGDESREDLLALAEMLPPSTEGDDSDNSADEEQKESEDGGDIRTGNADSEGSGSPEAG